VHSRYERRLADTAAAVREVVIRLRVRRFFSAGGGCVKKTFAEQVPRLTIRYGRVSMGLREVLRAIALPPGGPRRRGLGGGVPAGVNRMTLILCVPRILSTALTSRVALPASGP
jgi:hypothetical protein